MFRLPPPLPLQVLSGQKSRAKVSFLHITRNKFSIRGAQEMRRHAGTSTDARPLQDPQGSTLEAREESRSCPPKSFSPPRFTFPVARCPFRFFVAIRNGPNKQGGEGVAGFRPLWQGRGRRRRRRRQQAPLLMNVALGSCRVLINLVDGHSPPDFTTRSHTIQKQFVCCVK